ncbi:MAG: HEAT repeat domain-containing protein [bacterium]|nr:HEAT repeat domain-containing protein [bacterium]
MIQSLLKHLGVTDREFSRLLSMSLLYFLIFLGFGFGRSANESFFLKVAGATMIPYMYIFNAVITVFVSAAYSLVEDRLPRYRLFYIILTVFSASLFWLRLEMAPGMETEGGETSYWLPFAVFTFYELLLNLIQIHFWTYANDVFDPREGKRNLPLVGGAGLIGLITGGVLVGQVLRFDGIDTEDIFVVWSVILLLAVPAVYWSRTAAAASGVQIEASPGRDEGVSLKGMGELLNTPLIRTIALIQIPLWFVVNTVDWLFLTAMEIRYADDTERTAVLGLLNAFVALSGLLIQLLITGPFLRKAGVANAFLVYPITMTIGSLSLAVREFVPVGYAALRTNLAKTVRFLDEGILNSIFESSLNLLYNAIPGEKRGQARALINGMVEPGAIMLGGIMLVLFEAYSVSYAAIAMGCAATGLVWIWLARRVRHDYMHALVDSLNSRDHQLRARAITELGEQVDESTVAGLFSSLGSDDHEVAMLSLDYLLRLKNESVLHRLTQSLPFVESDLQIRIVSHLSECGFQEAGNEILALCDAKDPEVQVAALRALGALQRGAGDSESRKKLQSTLQRFLKSRVPIVRRAAVVAGLPAPEDSLNRRGAAFVALRGMVRGRDMELRLQAAHAIRESGRRDLLDLLLELARSKNRDVRLEAVRALGHSGDASVVPTLIQYLTDDELGHTSHGAIVRLQQDSLEPLHAALPAADDAHRGPILQCLGEIADSKSAAVLGQTIEDLHYRQESIGTAAAVQALGRIQERVTIEHPDDYPEMLAELITPDMQDILREVLEVNLARMNRDDVQRQVLSSVKNDRARVLLLDALVRESTDRENLALEILELLSDPGMVRTAAVGLRSPNRRAIADSVELLEGVGPEGAEVAALFESRYLDDDTIPPGLSPALPLQEILNEPQHDWTIAAALYAVGELKLRKLAPIVRKHKQHHDPLIRANVGLALKRLGERPPSGPGFRRPELKAVEEYMERILFLRSVPLFAHIHNEDLKLLNQIARIQSTRKKQIIFHEFDSGDAMYIVLSGSVRLLKGEDKTELLKMKARECFGEMAILDREPRSATVQVVEPGELMVIERADFQNLLAEQPRLVMALLRTMSGRLRDAAQRYADSRGLDADAA